MKKILIWGALVAVAGYVAYRYYQRSTGNKVGVLDNPDLLDKLTRPPTTGGIMPNVSSKEEKMNG